MNEYDSNRILDLVKPIGYFVTNNPSDADCYVLNTCHIREKATDKVYHDIGRLKKEFRNKKKPMLLVTGCVAQAESEEMLNREKYIDGIVGPQSYHQIPEIIKKIENNENKINCTEFEVVEKFDTLNLVKNSNSKISSFLTIQEVATILFNPESGETKSMRSKEEANDYRYFPDPDLLPLIITDKDIEEIKKTMPELPEAMKNRFEKDLGLSIYDSEGITSNRDVTKYFLELVDLGTNAKLAANWVLGNLFSQLNDKDIDILDSPISPAQLSTLINRIEDATISNNAAKKIFEILWENTGKKVDLIIDDLGLKQISDSNEIDKIVDEVLKNHSTMVEEFKSGKEKAFNALIGQVMKVSKGKANPAQVSSILKEKISK